MSFESAWHEIASVKGWLARDEARALYSAAAAVPIGQWIVEIGSHHGRSTTALVRGKRPTVPLLAIDPLRDDSALEAFRMNMRRIGAGAGVTLFRGTSAEAARAHRPSIGLLFIDGLHDRASVLFDIDTWEPLVVEGGLVAFHDAFFRRGVTEALFLRHLWNRDFRYMGSTVNLSIFSRDSTLGRGSRLVSALRLTARTFRLIENVAATIGVCKEWPWLQRLFPPDPNFEYRGPRTHR